MELIWVVVVGYLGWLPDPHTALSHSSSSTGWREKIRWKSPWAEMKAGRSVTNYHCRQKQIWLEQNYAIYCQLKTELADEKEWKTKTPFPISPPFFPSYNSYLHSWLFNFLHEKHRGTENESCGQSIMLCSILLLHAYSPLLAQVPFSWDAVSQLIQYFFFSQTIVFQRAQSFMNGVLQHSLHNL